MVRPAPFYSGSIPILSFRLLTKSASTHWPIRWHSCIGFAANWRRGRVAFVRRFRRKPFGRAEVFGASKEAGVGFREKPYTTTRAEAALALDCEELERSTRYFSADASHQLKSPGHRSSRWHRSFAVARRFKQEIYEELSALLHHDASFDRVIDELLLLSRHGRGHLQIASTPVNLSQGS